MALPICKMGCENSSADSSLHRLTDSMWRSAKCWNTRPILRFSLTEVRNNFSPVFRANFSTSWLKKMKNKELHSYFVSIKLFKMKDIYWICLYVHIALTRLKVIVSKNKANQSKWSLLLHRTVKYLRTIHDACSDIIYHINMLIWTYAVPTSMYISSIL